MLLGKCSYKIILCASKFHHFYTGCSNTEINIHNLTPSSSLRRRSYKTFRYNRSRNFCHYRTDCSNTEVNIHNLALITDCSRIDLYKICNGSQQQLVVGLVERARISLYTFTLSPMRSFPAVSERYSSGSICQRTS